jgi:amino acid adenylation domain-containing protein
VLRGHPRGCGMTRSRSATPRSLVDLVRARAEQNPERVALRFFAEGEEETESLSYARLDARARACGAALTDAGVAGRPVLLVAPAGPSFLCGLLGALYAGAVPVPAPTPVDERARPRLRRLAEDAGAGLVLAPACVRDRYREGSDERSALDAFHWLAVDEVPEEEASSWRPPRLDADGLALLQYTSGSTRRPRGVMLSHANLVHNAQAMCKAAGIGPDSTFVSWLPPHHDMGLIGTLLAPLSCGSQVCVMPPAAFLQRPARWLHLISRLAADVSGGPNFAYEICLRRIPEEEKQVLDLSSWRVAFNGAERIRAETLERFTAAFAPFGLRPDALRACYGLAEATLCVSIGEQSPWHASAPRMNLPRVPSSGHPLEDTEVRIVDPETRTERQPGEIGEIWIAGPSVGQGYWRDPEHSEEVFGAQLGGETRRYLRTGDLGFMEAGELYVTGRLKELIILLGRNHHPEDIEASIQGCHPSLRAAAAAFSVDADGQERLVIAQEVERRRDLDVEAIAAAVRGAVAEAHDVPLHALVLLAPGSLPKTTSGKVQRAACREAFEAGRLEAISIHELGSESGAEEDHSDARLVSLVAETMARLLGVESIGSHDDFFELGGHSLLATQVMSRLSESENVDLPLRLVFESPTPAALARRIRSVNALSARPRHIERLSRRGELPLSFAQERLWFLHQLAPQSSAYNVAGALHIEGPLEVEALRKSLAALVERHEVLRSAFPSRTGRPFQVVHAELAIDVPLVDLNAHGNPQAEVERLTFELADQVFVLEEGPLIRAALYRTSANEHVLALCMHHIVSDAWSLAIGVRELFELYEAEVAGETADLPALTHQFVDYAQWQRDRLREGGFEHQLDYWRRKLREGPPDLRLPTDRPRAARSSFEGETLHRELSKATVGALHGMSVQNRATLFMVLLSAFHVLLHRYSGATDLAVGTPIANRNRLASESLIGPLVNMLVMRGDLGGDPTFLELLERTREVVLQAFDHQDVPFERVVAELNPERSAGGAPFFRVMFDHQSVPVPRALPSGLRLRPHMVGRQGSQFDLSLAVVDTGEGHVARMEFDTSLFDRTTAGRMLDQFLVLLDALAEDPTRRISALPLLSDEERRQLIQGWNRTSRDFGPFRPFTRHVEARAAEQADVTAVVFRECELSYGDLNASANRLAAGLRRLGVRAGTRVAVFLERSLELPVALLGVAKALAAYVPIDPSHPEERIQRILEEARPTALVIHSSLRASVPSLGGAPILCIDEIMSSDERPSDPIEEPAPEAPAYVVFTSGSTGGPKGVEVTHRSLENLLNAMREEPGIDADDRLLSVTTPTFDIAALELFLPLVVGARVEIAERAVAEDAERLRDKLETSEFSIMQATPSTWQMLLGAGWSGDPRLEILCGGEILRRELAAALLERCARLWNMYGPTEATIWSALHRVESAEGRIPIGRPIANTQLYVLDPWGEPAPVGVRGELYIGGHGVARGYLGRPDLTAERFPPDRFRPDRMRRLYRTGDLVRRRADGCIEFLGRMDDQVKIRGHRVEPGEIEVLLSAHPQVEVCVVVPRSDRSGSNRLVAYYVPRSPDPLLRAELRGFIEKKLPRYMVPSDFVSMAELPRASTGKIDRRALPAPEHVSRSHGSTTEPRDEIEEKLQHIWQEILERRPIGVDEDFFDIGGHSLLAVELVARIRKAFESALPLHTLFEARTIAGLASLVRDGSWDASPIQIVVLRDGWLHPPLLWLPTLTGDGNIWRYRRLAPLLGDAQPVWAIEKPVVDCGTFAELARSCVRALRNRQPEGPYCLVGYSNGGNLAHEVACQLHEGGQEVSFLALIDSRPPAQAPSLRQRVGSAARRWVRDPAGPGGPGESVRSEIDGKLLQQLDAHRGRFFRGRMTLLQTRSSEPRKPLEAAWRAFAEALDVAEVPGGHLELLEEPHVQVVAERLLERLRIAQANLELETP